MGNQIVSSSVTGAEVIAFRADTSVAAGNLCGAFLIGNSDTSGTEDHFVGMWGKVSSTNGSQDLHFAAGRSGYEGDTPVMTLASDGQLGLGTTAPNGKFQIEADGSAEDILVINNTRSGSNSTAIQQFKREGTNTGYIANTSSSTSYVTSQSDRRAKKNFEDWTENVLSHFKNLKPTKFHFTQEDDSSEKNKGYIAQDLVDSFPEAYPLKNEGEDADRYFFNPSGMVVYLMKAIQEQQLQIEALQEKISALENS